MVRKYKLKDDSEIREIGKGVYSIIFPNKRFVIVTTWKEYPELDIAGFGTIQLHNDCNIFTDQRRK